MTPTETLAAARAADHPVEWWNARGVKVRAARNALRDTLEDLSQPNAEWEPLTVAEVFGRDLAGWSLAGAHHVEETDWTDAQSYLLWRHPVWDLWAFAEAGRFYRVASSGGGQPRQRHDFIGFYTRVNMFAPSFSRMVEKVTRPLFEWPTERCGPFTSPHETSRRVSLLAPWASTPEDKAPLMLATLQLPAPTVGL